MYYQTIIIVGSGKIACECSKTLFEKEILHKVIEGNPSQLSMLEHQSKHLGVEMINLNNDQTIDHAILENADGNTLVISANNEHIFKDNVFRSDITIINFHYGYLPDYRGMNIPTWVIYNDENYTGVTWHYVNQNVDDGNIISQRKIEIMPDDTALNITRQVMLHGIDSFRDFIFDFLNKPIIGKENIASEEMHSYRKRQLPGNGFLDTEDDAILISRMLRAYDYGPLEYIPKLKVIIDKKIYKIEKYRIIKNNKLLVGIPSWTTHYTINKDTYTFELMLKKEDD